MNTGRPGEGGTEAVRHGDCELAVLSWSRVATDDGAMARCLALTSAQERQQARRYRFERDRRRFLARRATVRRMLADRLGRDPATLHLGRTPRGKPFLEDAGVAFSVSYADDLVLVATATAHAIGCDVVSRGAERLAWPHADVLFSAREVAAMGSAADPAGDFFIRAWTLKEACGKAVGCGLVGKLHEFDTTRIHDRPSLVTYAGSEWVAWSWECIPGYQTAIVVACPEFSPII